jgi:hypothetical protein
MAFLAAIGALGAWWISWREARRNNKIIVKLKSFKSFANQDQSGISHKLEVYIVNRGIQLQNISMYMNFYGLGKSGNSSIPIPLSKYSKGLSSTFLRGSIACFMLTSSDIMTSHSLSILRDIKEQRPIINLYNNSFLACSFPIYSRWDRIKKLWNRSSFKLMFKRRVGEGCNGKGVFKFYQLPYFEIRSEQLRLFLNGISQNNVGDEQTTLRHNVEGPVESPPPAD